MKKKFLFLGALIIATSFFSCEDGEGDNLLNEDNNNGGENVAQLTAKFEGIEGCFDYGLSDLSPSKMALVDPYLSYGFDEATGDVKLSLERVVYSCGGSTPTMDFSINGDTISYSVYDATPDSLKSDCICFFKLNSLIEGAISKKYYLRPESSDDMYELDLSINKEGVINL